MWNDTNHLTWVRQGCPENTSVKSLFLRHNMLLYPDIIDICTKLPNLRTLSLTHCHISKLPDEFGEFKNLTTLDLSWNNLESIPSSFFKLKKLQSLLISYNNLTSIPDEIGELTNLWELSVAGNKLTKLPSTIGNLSSLYRLQCYNNNISEIPRELANLTSLECLDLGNNSIKTVPVELRSLSNLEFFGLTNNEISSLPLEIWMLPKLLFLTLCKNRLTTVPAQFGMVPAVLGLSISENPIEFLPLNIERILDVRTEWDFPNYKGTWSDRNSTTRESMLRLLDQRITRGDIMPLVLEDNILADLTKNTLVKCCEDTAVHTELYLTFSDVLTVVWNRIVENPHSEDIKRALNNEMRNVDSPCFEDYVCRLIRCLDKLDPLVRISEDEPNTCLQDRGEYKCTA